MGRLFRLGQGSHLSPVQGGLNTLTDGQAIPTAGCFYDDWHFLVSIPSPMGRLFRHEDVVWGARREVVSIPSPMGRLFRPPSTLCRSTRVWSSQYPHRWAGYSDGGYHPEARRALRLNTLTDGQAIPTYAGTAWGTHTWVSIPSPMGRLFRRVGRFHRLGKVACLNTLTDGQAIPTRPGPARRAP